MRARLALMPAVAIYKWQHQLPVLDPAREAVVLDETVERAETLGIEGNSARALFALQMTLARALQERTIADLNERGLRGAPVRDLTRVLRPQLDRIGQELLLTLARVQPALAAPDLVTRERARAARLLAPFGVSADETNALLSALAALRTNTRPLYERIVAREELRVGTTGDYAPFSLEQRRVLSGLDITRAQRFAASLGVSVRFVRTRWSTLMQDYARGLFDLAASGISITPERSAVARFSLPYHHGGKTAIGRCKERDKLASLAAIDQPTVRVIVNPGGTNEAFARSQLSHADLRVFPDNRSIFMEIVRGRADVMVSDDVEVALQAELHPELCRTTQELFAPADKAWLVQHDDQLVRAADAFLKAELAAEPAPSEQHKRREQHHEQ
jgi:cyclohexadienyl dehydratase